MNASLGAFFSILLLAATPGLAGAQGGSFPPRKAVRISFPDSEALRAFLALPRAYEAALSERPGTLADFLMTEIQVEGLQASGLSFEILPEGKLLDLRVPPPIGASAGPVPYSNYSFASMLADLQALAAAHPGEASLTVFGYGHDGNPMYLMKVSDNVSKHEDEPRVLFMGVHHAGEAIGVDCCMNTLHYLLDNYGADLQATAYVNDNEIYVAPMANPDGWMKIQNGVVASWRKNTRDNNGNGSFDPSFDGVDLNRNFSFHWGLAGSPNPPSSTYYGPSPLSEPEDQAIAPLGALERFALALTYHMSGEVIIYPWTYLGQKTPDHPTYSSVAAALASKINSIFGGAYAPVVAGDTGGYVDDHLYGLHGTLCFTVEVTAANTTPSINLAVANNLPGAKYILDRVKVGQVTGRVANAKTSQPVSAKVEILQVNSSALPDRTSDPQFGRYRWILDDGTYTLRVSSTQGYQTATVPGLLVTSSAATVQDVLLAPLEAWVGGTPQIGTPVTFNLEGIAGEGYYQFFGFATANIPIPPFAGTLQIDPASLFVLAAGTLPGTGSVSVPIGIPNNPALVGFEVYYQAITGPSLLGGQGHFTNLAWFKIQ